ncbi:hypothetical protein ZWY2020_009021 [Hordeum vulgare]|nr:hypothetical protein ZWY2020_009021 [Hordeum vulgare]
MRQVLAVAALCMSRRVDDRLVMKDVVALLEEIRCPSATDDAKPSPATTLPTAAPAPDTYTYSTRLRLRRVQTPLLPPTPPRSLDGPARASSASGIHKEEFEEYAEKAKALPDITTNESKLCLYSLYKQATVSPVNTVGLVGCARADAGSAGGRGGMGPAGLSYVTLGSFSWDQDNEKMRVSIGCNCCTVMVHL